jgi:competence ComEA-like helix-hairpin-helix protein
MDDFMEHPKTNFTEFKKQIAKFEVAQDSLNEARKQSYQTAYKTKRDSLYKSKSSLNKQYSANYQNQTTKSQFKPFTFNPNTIPAEKFKQLGFKDWQVKTIENYRNKGGQFHKKEDLKKIYGVTPEQYSKIESYINIPPTKDFSPLNKNNQKQYDSNNKTTNNYKKPAPKPKQHLDLNRSSKEQLMKISGIGPAFSERIIKYRNQLGGYKYKTQLKEVWGITPEIYTQISSQLFVTNIRTKKLNINTLKAEELVKHPYINWNIANAIVSFREKHGNFMEISEIKKLHLVTDELYNKLQPYLTVK